MGHFCEQMTRYGCQIELRHPRKASCPNTNYKHNWTNEKRVGKCILPFYNYTLRGGCFYEGECTWILGDRGQHQVNVSCPSREAEVVRLASLVARLSAEWQPLRKKWQRQGQPPLHNSTTAAERTKMQKLSSYSNHVGRYVCRNGGSPSNQLPASKTWRTKLRQK